MECISHVSAVSAAKMKADSDSVATASVQNQNLAITEGKLANASVSTSKIGTLTSLTVNGLITATGFLASGYIYFF